MDIEMNKGYLVLNSGDYLDEVAPIDHTNDFSTAALMKNQGPNLTSDYLSQLSVEKMLEEIIVKAGLIDLERIVRTMKEACQLSKQ